jgi:hypothetical protein
MRFVCEDLVLRVVSINDGPHGRKRFICVRGACFEFFVSIKCIFYVLTFSLYELFYT